MSDLHDPSRDFGGPKRPSHAPPTPSLDLSAESTVALVDDAWIAWGVRDGEDELMSHQLIALSSAAVAGIRGSATSASPYGEGSGFRSACRGRSSPGVAIVALRPMTGGTVHWWRSWSANRSWRRSMRRSRRPRRPAPSCSSPARRGSARRRSCARSPSALRALRASSGAGATTSSCRVRSARCATSPIRRRRRSGRRCARAGVPSCSRRSGRSWRACRGRCGSSRTSTGRTGRPSTR